MDTFVSIWRRAATLAAALITCLAVGGAGAAEPAPKPDDVEAALVKAVRFFHRDVSNYGGYLWQYSGDLKLREAEGKIPSRTRAWVQPPGTPTIGDAFLAAYEATGDRTSLDAALDAAGVLLYGQMTTGGWAYSVELDPAQRSQWGYRAYPDGRASRWQRATVLDDDTTASAIGFLARLDRALGFKDAKVHEAVQYALDRVLTAQYPNGSWFGWWEYEPKPFSEGHFAVKTASYPETWPRTTAEMVEKYPARYVLNDDLVADMIRTLLDVWEVYNEERYLAAAKKAGDFLLRAQMPEPQPGWAQQYDISMHPCWGRKFEPPAISGAESQTVMECLLMLARRTGDRKYLEPFPRALAYFRRSLLPDGQLSRFYELRTNKPLYFNQRYELVYTSDEAPTHYRFLWESRLDAIEAEYRRLTASKALPLADAKPDAKALAPRVAEILKGLDGRGAWVEKGALRFHKTEPASGVINCQTFADNARTLSQYLIASRGLRVKEPVLAGGSRFSVLLPLLSGQVVPPPQPVRGDGAGRTGPREGDAGRTGPREGDTPRTGPREGDTPRTGPREGNAPRTGPRDGDAPREGPRDGDRPREGPRDGDAPREGPRDGERPPKEGPRER